MTRSITSDHRQREALAVIASQHQQGLRAAVAREALGADYEIKLWFSDLFQHGCISGMVGSLIYYTDTHAYFDKHYDEIQDLMCEHDWDGIKDRIFNDGADLKNTLAWWAFEVTALDIANQLGLN